MEKTVSRLQKIIRDLNKKMIFATFYISFSLLQFLFRITFPGIEKTPSAILYLKKNISFDKNCFLTCGQT
jgi:hypothetical protein